MCQDGTDETAEGKSSLVTSKLYIAITKGRKVLSQLQQHYTGYKLNGHQSVAVSSLRFHFLHNDYPVVALESAAWPIDCIKLKCAVPFHPAAVAHTIRSGVVWTGKKVRIDVVVREPFDSGMRSI